MVSLWPGMSVVYVLGNTNSLPRGYLSTGSGLHAMRALSQPRWEDFEYERLDKAKNRFYWLGDGQTVSEKTMEGNREYIIIVIHWSLCSLCL